MAQTAALDAQKASQKSTGQIFDHLFFRHWDSWFTGKYRHLFVMGVQYASSKYSVGIPVDMMLDQSGDCPSKPWGGSEEYAFSPIKARPMVAYSLQVGNDQAWSINRNVYLAPLPDGRSPVMISGQNKARHMIPAWSPDGTKVAYLGTEEPGAESDRNRIVIFDTASLATRVLTEGWDRSVDSIYWPACDPTHIYALAEDLAHTRIFAVSVADGSVVRITSDHNVGAVSIGAGRIVAAIDAYLFPSEIFSMRLDGSDLRQLTNRNRPLLAQVDLAPPEELHFRGAYGDQVQAFFFRPTNWTAASTYPLILYVHGGPEDPWMDSWSYRWNPETLVAQGYCVFAVNFHGSSSFGDSFTRSIRLNWGGAPFDDLMLGLDFITAQYPWIDSTRMAAMGASYGGYMLYWLAGNAPQRFKALIAHDGVFDCRAHYYETEELWFPETEFGFPPFVDQEYYEKWNPADFVKNWSVPMLVIHGGQDFRIPDTQGFGAFTALQRRGIPSKMLYFPNENHWVLDPNNSILWHDTVLAWLHQYV